MKRIPLILLLLLFCASVSAQSLGRLRVFASPDIENLVRNHITYNQRHPRIDGFRIRVYRDNGNAASRTSQEIANTLSAQLADVAIYRDYTNPYFRVSIGDYRSKDEALRMLPRIKQLYPTAYIVPEQINLPEL